MNKFSINLAPQFTTMLTILFIGLKLTNVVSWSWWWVLSPIWIPLAIFSSILLIVFVGYVVVKCIVK